MSSKPPRMKKHRYLTDNDSANEEQMNPAAVVDLTRRLRIAERRNNGYVLKQFRSKTSQKHTYLTDCCDSSQSDTHSDSSPNPNSKKRLSAPINNSWERVRKLVKGNEQPPAKAMTDTISHANDFIKQIRQNLNANKK
jgi:hypothetical protein